MVYSNYIIYVDESGDHSLKIIDKEYPLFVLTFCLVSKTDYQARIIPQVVDFKHRWFGHEAVILHAHDIRKGKGDFRFLFDRKVRGSFMEDLTTLMDRLPYILVASAINKVKLNYQYSKPYNPYSFAIELCLERAFHYLQDRSETDNPTHVLVESRGRKEDTDLEQVFLSICDGENFLGHRLPFEVVFVDKKQNLSGLQLADLVCHPIGRYLLKPEQNNRAYEVVEKKFHRGTDGKLRGYGLKIFP